MSTLLMRRTAEQTAARRTAEQLAALYAADGIRLDPAVIPQASPPPSLSLRRDAGLEARAAAKLLGGEVLELSDQGGGLSLYRSGRGQVLFRSNGGFEASGRFGEGEELCRSFCHSFSYDLPSFPQNGADGTVLAVRHYQGLPVFNCTIRFTLEDGQLTAVSGTLLPEEGTPAAGEPAGLSAAGALNAFLQMRRENAAVASSVTGVHLCYELQSASAASMTLAPAWCVATDLANYYVNCLTGAVTEGESPAAQEPPSSTGGITE